MVWAVRERPALFRRVQQAQDGCLLTGPAGIGKTTAAREALDVIGQPYVIVHGFDGLAEVPFAALSAACTEDRPAGPGASTVDADIVRRLRRSLCDLVARGVWVIVDDADVVDPPSSGLLSYLAQTEGLHLIATMRPDRELPSDLYRLALHRSWPTIAVEPWTEAEVRDALNATCGGTVAADLVSELHRLSEGVPLVLRELLLAAIDRSSIRRVEAEGDGDGDGEARLWAGSASVASARDAARLIGRRLPTTGPALAVLQTLAIAGPIRPALLDRLATRELLVGLDADGLLSFPDHPADAFVRLSHPMLADALRAGVVQAERRRLLHEVVAAARHLGGRDDDDHLQYLRWVVEIGEPLPDDDLRDGYHLALRWFDYALAADIAGALNRRQPNAEAALFHAVALARANRFAEAATIADDARDLAATDDEVVAIGRLLVRLHSPIGRSMGYLAGRAEHAAEIARWADGRLGTPAFNLLLRSFTAFVDGELTQGLDLGQQALAVAALGPAGVREEADQFLVMAAQLAGRFDIARASQARLDTETHGSLAIPALMGSHGARVSLLMYDGRLREAFEQDDLAYRAASETLAYDEMMNAAGQRGLRAFLMGDLVAATSSLDLSLQYQLAPTSRGLLIRAVLAASYAMQGRHEQSLLVLDAGPDSPPRAETEILNLDFDHLAGLVHALAGVGEDNEDRIRRASDEALRVGYHWLHVLSRVTLVRLGVANEHDALSARQTVEAIDAPLINAAANLTLAAVARDHERLAWLADEFLAMEANLFAVDALRAALVILEGKGPAVDRGAVSRLARRLEETTQACPGLVDLHLPGTERREVVDFVLSEREREIAVLASAGATSKEIGTRLHLSPRTVDNNLRRVYTKLGIRKRGELGEALDLTARNGH